MVQVEHGLQVGVARLLELCLDPARAWFTGIDHAAKLSARYGADRKRRGVKPGLPDFLIFVEGDTPLGLEIKIGKGRLSESQRDLRDDWLRIGVRYEIARSLIEVQHILRDQGVPLRGNKIFFGGIA